MWHTNSIAYSPYMKNFSLIFKKKQKTFWFLSQLKHFIPPHPSFGLASTASTPVSFIFFRFSILHGPPASKEVWCSCLFGLFCLFVSVRGGPRLAKWRGWITHVWNGKVLFRCLEGTVFSVDLSQPLSDWPSVCLCIFFPKKMFLSFPKNGFKLFFLIKNKVFFVCLVFLDSDTKSYLLKSVFLLWEEIAVFPHLFVCLSVCLSGIIWLDLWTSLIGVGGREKRDCGGGGGEVI